MLFDKEIDTDKREEQKVKEMSESSLTNASQPPLTHPGATPDSDPALRPPLTVSLIREELNPGDRVMGVEPSGKPTWDFGTVEQTNEDDAVVKWDDDGRRKLHQESLKKI